MKKHLIFIIGILLAFAANGMSNLPPCLGTDRTSWSMCVATITYANGSQYVGEFNDYKSNGHGTYTNANGSKYVGQFKDGKRNGQGTYTLADGKRLEGIWKDDVFHVAIQATFAAELPKDQSNSGSENQTKNVIADSVVSLNEAKQKCKELGFKENTEKFGACVLKISK